MKKTFILCAILMGFGFFAKAAPGDTTWVQGNITYLDGYGNYDSAVVFPSASAGVTYRKIYMIFTLGKHMCPAGSTYCGDWDYTVQNYLMVPGGDTLEIGRLITPYANAGAPRTPWTWQQHYVYDVTDYATLLHGTEFMRIFYSGYSGGFTANIKFAFIEGTPERTPIAVHRLWDGSWGYGGTPDINSHFPVLTETAPTGTQTATLKFTVTGHGSDANGCCEFAAHNYQVMLNGASVATKTIWRDNCGSAELYPQSGTWLYQRGNWCPGAMVYSNYHDLPGITAGSTFNVAMNFDAYTGGGSYTTDGALIYYGGMNKTLDASLDDIIAPTNDENHFRENPTCGSPVIHVKNTGAATIDSIKFQYGIQDSAMQTFTWVGTLAPLEDTDVTLPILSQYNSISGTAGVYTFVAQIQSVNGMADADPTNDKMASQFVAAPLWPNTFKILFKPNNEATTTGGSISETAWAIYDVNNNIVASRTGATINTVYADTINLPLSGSYRLQISDSSCDGLHWWVWDSDPSAGVNAGYLNVKKLPGTNIAMNGYSYSGTYNNDFGCGYTQYFYVINAAQGITNITSGDVSIEAYPNPAQNVVNVDIAGIQQVNGTIQVLDALGRVVTQTNCYSAHQAINVSQLANGVYTIAYINTASGNRLTTRLLITK